MPDITWTMGLDAKAFASGIAAGIRGLGHVGLAIEGLKKIGSGFSAPIMKAAQFEKTTTAINTLTKDMNITKAVMRDLTKLAADTPFEMSDLAPAARALIASGTAALNVTEDLRMLGDAAAGGATDLGGLVTVFNQVMDKGRLMGGEMLQFAERGIGGALKNAIAEVEKIDLEQVSDQIEKGEVSADDTRAAFKKLTSVGGAFFNAMKAQSQTFLGKLSTLQDAWDMMMVKFATPIMDAMKPMLDDATGKLDLLAPLLQRIGSGIGNVLAQTRVFLKELGNGTGAITAMKAAWGDLFKDVGRIIAIPFSALGAAMPRVRMAFEAVMSPTIDWLENRLALASLKMATTLGFEMARALLPLTDMPLIGDQAGAVIARMAAGVSGMVDAGRELEKRGATLEGAMVHGAVEAAAHLDTFGKVFVNRLTSGLDDVTKVDANGMVEGQVPYFYNPGMVDLKKAIKDNTAATKENTEELKPDEEGRERKRIMGYSWEKQGGATEARKRAAQRVTDSRVRVEEQKGKWYHRAAGFGGALMPSLPPGLSGGRAASGNASRPDPQMNANNNILTAMLKELQRLRIA